MNTLTVQRILSDNDATFGVMSLNGRFVCHTIEDRHREEKVWGETRIPAGTYRVTLRDFGGFHERYSKKFPDMHQGMLWVRNVPGFEDILIHIGNTAKDSAGCILVGQAPPAFLMAYRVDRSTDTYKSIYPELARLAAKKELQLTIKDYDNGD